MCLITMIMIMFLITMIMMMIREFREKRPGTELVKDTVELSLQTEQEIIKQHQEILKGMLTEVEDFV